MPSLRSVLLGFAAMSSASLAKEKLQVVWSSGHFSTIAGPNGGNEFGHDSGFAVTNDKGQSYFDSAYPADHAPCYNTGDGREFKVMSSCWKAPRSFKCKSNFGGNPESCEVFDSVGNSLAKGKGNTDTKFIGIALTQSSSCGVNFELEADEHCDDKAEWRIV